MISISYMLKSGNSFEKRRPNLLLIFNFQFLLWPGLNRYHYTVWHIKVQSLNIVFIFSKGLSDGNYILTVNGLWFPSLSAQSITLGRWMEYRWKRNVWKCSGPVRCGLKKANQANWFRIMMVGFLMHIQRRLKKCMKFNCTIKLSQENIYCISSRETLLLES